MIVETAGLSFLLLAVGGLYLLSSIKKNKKYLLLTELGLIRGVLQYKKSPFYKWGWKKESDSRVWGERIVREAFEKANVGLNPDDLELLKQACDQHAAGKTVEKTNILNRIDRILERSESVSNVAVAYVHPLLTEAFNTPPQAAKAILDRIAIQSVPKNAVMRYAVYQFSEQLNSIGKIILFPNTPGFEIKAKTGETIMRLRGFEGWEHWLKACKGAVEQFIRLRTFSGGKEAVLYLKTQILDNIIQKFLDDSAESQQYVYLMGRQIVQDVMSLNVQDIKYREMLFYQWQFADDITFTMRDHKKIRELFSQTDLIPRFREILIQSITPLYDSLPALANRFPRHVIFYGKDSSTRSFAAQQYLQHLFSILKFIAGLYNQKPRIPIFLRILDSDVARARSGEAPQGEEAEPKTRKRKGEAEEEGDVFYNNRGHMPQLLDYHKKLIVFEKNLDPYAAEKMGWIVEVPVDEFTLQEHAQFDMGDYLTYKRIDCSRRGDVDVHGDDKTAKSQCRQFLNAILNEIVSPSGVMKINDE
ncbi:MAG: hypothetical protein AB1656_24275 [Candidatus Omnitrophota bacterium]